MSQVQIRAEEIKCFLRNVSYNFCVSKILDELRYMAPKYLAGLFKRSYAKYLRTESLAQPVQWVTVNFDAKYRSFPINTDGLLMDTRALVGNRARI